MRDTVPGEHVDPLKTLFVVVDPQQMWLLVDLRIEDAQAVLLGKLIRLGTRGPARGGRPSSGSAPRRTTRRGP